MLNERLIRELKLLKVILEGAIDCACDNIVRHDRLLTLLIEVESRLVSLKMELQAHASDARGPRGHETDP